MEKKKTPTKKKSKGVKGKLPDKFLHLEHGDRNTLSEEVKNVILDYFIWHKLENGTVMLRFVPSPMFIGINIPIASKDAKKVHATMASTLMNELVRKVI